MFTKRFLAGGCTLVAFFAAELAVGQTRPDINSRTVLPPQDGEQLPIDRELPPPDARALMLDQDGSTAIPQQSTNLTTAADPAVSYTTPWYTRWPLVAPAHRLWISRTKPTLQRSHWGYPENFMERPFGSDVLQAEQMQVINGLQDQQVLYHYDFLPGDEGATLSPRGRYQLQKIIRRMEIATCPIVIQTSIDNPELDQTRREHVINAMREAGVAVVPEMVVVARPPLPGLQGTEGLLIYGNMLRQTQQQGTASGGGGGGSGLAIPVIGVGNGGR